MSKRKSCPMCVLGSGAYYVITKDGMERRTCPLPHDRAVKKETAKEEPRLPLPAGDKYTPF